MVERPLMVRWVVGSIPHGGPAEIFLVPVSGIFVRGTAWYCGLSRLILLGEGGGVLPCILMFLLKY